MRDVPAGSALPARGMQTGQAERLLGPLLPVAAAVASGAVLLQPGLIGAVDIWPHLVRQQAVYETLRAGASPFWTFLFYGGFPLLRFYGPLLALLGGTFQLVAGDALVTLKLVLFVLHGLSGWTMYVLLRRRVAPAAAGLGAAAYLLVPWRLISLVTEANLPQALVYVLLPLLLTALADLQPGNRRRGAAAFGLWFGLLLLAHPYYALLAGFLAFIVVLSGPGRGRRLPGLALGGLAAFAVAGFFVLPFLLEYRGHAYPVLPLKVPLPDLRVLLWPGSRAAGYRGFYLGLSVVLGGLAALMWAAPRRRRSEVLPDVVALGLGTLAAWLAPLVGLVPAGQPPGRALLLVVFGLAGLGTLGVDRLLVRAGKRARLVVIGLALVLAADCLPFIWRIRFLATGKALPVRTELYRLVPDRPSPRLLDLPSHADAVDDFPRLGVYPAAGYLFGGLASVLGPPYHQFAPAALMYGYPWAALVAADLGDATRRDLSPLTRKALALLGVTHVVTPATPVGSGCVLTKDGISWDDRFLRADRRPPLILGATGAGIALGSRVRRPVAGAVTAVARTLRYAGDWREMLERVQLDSAARMLDAIPVREGGYDSLPGDGPLVVSDWRVTHDRVRVELATAADCWVRLAVSWYPGFDIRIDGEPVPAAATADGFTYLRCPAGRHVVTVTAPLGILRSLLLPVSGLAIAACALAALLPVRGRRRKQKGT
jgi:hypothetical protein